MGMADNLAHVAVFDALPAVVVMKLSTVVVKVFVNMPTVVVKILVIVKLPTTIGKFNYVFNLIFSSCTKVAFLQNKVALPHTKVAYQKNY
jgi:uncharacterized membrane protein